MQKALQTLFGTMMTASGVAIHAWLWMGAETTGRGLEVGVKVLGVFIPAMIPIMAGFGLIVFGLLIGYGTSKQETVVPHT